ncbi:MAG: 3-deoxy-D-manno-octulosonic acid transferase [Taibaiella sp.]|nr:3-deoxy-D-manno-octulosonic acid transferase [Taibaiella sp.]
MLQTIIYRAGVGAYATGIKVASAFNPKAKLFVNGRKGLIGKISNALAAETRKVIWMHCASLGEFEQGRPLIEAIKERYGSYAILITFYSPSGYEVRKNYIGADYVFYLPVDNRANAESFLDLINPVLCLFVKYDLWYYYLSGLKKRNIPTFLVSAVFNERHGFFKWYGSLQRKMLHLLTHVFVQDSNSADLLTKIGLSNVTVSGDTRFDRVVKAAGNAGKQQIADEFCKGFKIVVAGSTWPADEALLQNVLKDLPHEWRLMLVPHNVDEAHIKSIEKLMVGETIRWSQFLEGTGKRILLVDRVGLLLELYQYSDISYIGGGFGKAGVHNVLEAAVYGVPCCFGPVYHQFIEAAELLKQDGAQMIKNSTELTRAILNTNDRIQAKESGAKGKNYILSRTGATENILTEIAVYLNQFP